MIHGSPTSDFTCKVKVLVDVIPLLNLIFLDILTFYNISIAKSLSIQGARCTCNLSEDTNSHHIVHPIINMVCFLSNFLSFLTIVTIDYYIINLPSIMDSFLGLLNSRALLILRAHSTLLGFYSILGVLVL